MRILLFGRGSGEHRLRQEVSDSAPGDRVLFMGFRNDLPDVLPCLEMVVHPATMEGLGVSLLQASSDGVLIVASRAGGIPEAVREGVNGLLVPAGDARALGKAIRRLLDDEALAERLGSGGRNLMRGEFSIDAMVDGNLAVYRELLGEDPGDARSG